MLYHPPETLLFACHQALQELQIARLEVGKVQEMLRPPEPEEEPQEEEAQASTEQVSRGVCWAVCTTRWGTTPCCVGTHDSMARIHIRLAQPTLSCTG